MHKAHAQFVAAMVVLTGLALYLAVGAARHREGMAAFIMLVIAAIFWSKTRKRS
jgi:hypothetical protein